MRLLDKARSVRKEQDIFHPVRLHQHIHAGDGNSRLAGSGRHDDQAAAAVLRKCLAYSADQ